MVRCLIGLCVSALLPGMCMADVFDEMLPAPREVERRGGSIGGFGLANVEVRRASVPGAPAKTADEAYILEITPSNVCITAASMRGERWARVTLDQLLRLSGGERVPCCRIVDWPALKWRGYMNDCGRNFLELDGVKAIIDMMSRYKMNLFHWHLSDYHGWRLESKRYPQLQDNRAFVRQVGKYYTQREFREVVRYAAERGVTVMPELDVPGHTLAFRRGMGVDSMSNECVRVALKDIFSELCSLAPADVMPFVHLGTDEVRVDPERCPGEWLDEWVETVTSNGRSAVLWAPGEKTKARGTIIDMVWYDNHVTNSPNAFIDAARMYNGSWTSFDILKRAAFLRPCNWKGVEDARKLGAVTCTWHDDNVGEDTYRLFVDAMVFPTIMLFGDNYWRGRDEDCPQFFARLPDVDDPRFAFAEDLERRAVAQRDKCLDDFRFPFPLVAQTGHRWRIADANGNVVATNVPDATVWFSSIDRKEDASVGYPVPGKSATAETWIWSPKRQSVGAWVDFTLFGCAYGRTTLPDHGEWNKAGAKIELNGQEMAPPRWKRPGARARTPSILRQDVPWTNDLHDTPFTDEGCVRREPYPIILKEGWNHVRVTVPYQYKRWGFIFSPVLGSSEHPREVPGLKYSSSDPAALAPSGVGDCRMPDNAYIVQNVRGYNSWPMIQAMGGKLVCTYSRDNAFPADGHTINPGSRDSYAKVSVDGGRTWSEEVTVANDPKIGEVNEGIGLDSTGAVIAWVRCWGAADSRRHELYRTTDGVSFEKIASLRPRPFPMQIMDPVIVPGLGLVSPWFAGHYRKDGENSWGILVSTDDGRTWEQRTIESGLSVKEWVTEPSLVSLGGGRILIVGRCEQGLGTQFQVTSSDGGKTWTKRRTNIGDVRESTPSLVYDPKTGLVANYYYHRGARKLKRRVVDADFIFTRPASWPEPEVLAEGHEPRAYDAGNVKATRLLGKSDCCAWYTGTQSNSTVVVTVVPAPVSEAAPASADGPRISVFAKFIRNIARQRGISKAEAADLLYGIGVRGFDAGPGESDLDELAATRLKPINFYYFPDWFGRNGSNAVPPDECLAKAVRLGVPRIMVVPPNFTDGKDNPAEFERILSHMKAFVAEAKKRSITVTVEDFGGTANCCSYAKYLKRFLNEIPDIRFALDSGNLYYAGRGEDIIEMMEFAKGRIGHVHLKDQLPTDNRAYATLGLGAVPNERIVKAIGATDYDGWFTLENPVGDVLNDTVRQVALLKSWLSSVGK